MGLKWNDLCQNLRLMWWRPEGGAEISLAKLSRYAWLGQLQLTNLATSLVLAPHAPLGIWLGR